MAYLNSDDLLAPARSHSWPATSLATRSVDALYSHRVFLTEDKIMEAYWILPAHRGWLMTRWDYIPQETCFWRRRIYEATGGIDPSFRFALDYDLFVRFMERGRLRRVPRFLGAFRRHASAKTAGLIEGQVHPEVERVRREHHVWMPRGHGRVEKTVFDWIAARSQRFAVGGAILPGGLAGTAYDYDRVWEGLLTASRLPA